MADRIVVMNHGRIEQIGTPTEIYRDPATLFVADFIGETNRVATTFSGGSVRVGDTTLATQATGFAEGAAVTMAVRPEDVLPHAGGHTGAPLPNHLAVRIEAMEFLGSYWRTHLSSPALGATPLVANFSMNAVRRLDLSVGAGLTVELPAERVLVFARGGDNG